MAPHRNKKKTTRTETCDSLLNFKKLPTFHQVNIRRSTLQTDHIGKKSTAFLPILAKEIEGTWTKQDIPCQNWRTIYKRLIKMPPKDKSSTKLFDCLPTNPRWKTQEDKKYYLLQKDGLGGYCTEKSVSFKPHPRNTLDRSNRLPRVVLDEESKEVNTRQQDNEAHNKVQFAEALRRNANLSLSQTVAVMKFYKETFTHLSLPEPPHRSSVCRKSTLVNNSFCNEMKANSLKSVLYFDTKTFINLYGKNRPVICVCIDNKLVKFKELSGKGAASIYSELTEFIDLHNVRYIVADTEATITGKKSGVFARLKAEFPDLMYEPCRLHILDLILKHEIINKLGDTKTFGPDLPYQFVQQVRSNWDEKRTAYQAKATEQLANYEDLPSTESRRDDYRFLLSLAKALRQKVESSKLGIINIPNRPVNISNARWNSKAIFCLFYELSSESVSDEMHDLNIFIAYKWCPVWFGVRTLADWSKLNGTCSKGLAILEQRNLKNCIETSPYTNEQAERIFRMAREIIPRVATMNNLEKYLIRYVNDGIRLN